MIVFLWDAPAPGGTARGITDNEARARLAAEAWLRAGADSARVERATLRHGGAWLTDGYQRTGSGWTARRHGDRPSVILAALGAYAPDHAEQPAP